jgi:hypothetical protein
MAPKLPKLHPVKFPSDKVRHVSVVYEVGSKQGRPTREVIAEMKRLSKKDIFPTPK